MPEEVRYPVGEPQEECAICKRPLGYTGESYPNMVCQRCDREAVNADGEKPKRGAAYREKLKAETENPDQVDVASDDGENPVFIHGQKCWRRYRFGGYITRLDQYDCDTIHEFVKTHRPEF